MPVSLAGVIGAAIGLYIGWLDYKIVAGVLNGRLDRRKQRKGAEDFLVRNREGIRILVLITTIIGFPVIGYIAAVSMTG
ncbi:hypothetical protein GR183_19170 [Stappia sp. GBMRC 2046]|uniref:Uncharacterized protein n=1 Tax=Stappia sediminis TaxID=2692190 RepID=A0A7X3LXR8_9HYPH|nr:hypothetical protein [Stappia sediminis]MXN67040.1 hypothetical protein [Stappia sediminis]